MSPFRKVLMLSTGDFLAKALYFLAFIYLAHKLGVASYGALEFAISLRAYLLLFSDGGLEVWSIREASKNPDVRSLVARLVPFRVLLASIGCFLLVVGLQVLPDNPNLRLILPVFGLTVVVQAANLKWLFMGQQQVPNVVTGLMGSQAIFAAGVFALVRTPEDIIWVPLSWLAGELVMTGYLWWLFVCRYGHPSFTFRPRDIAPALRPGLTMGAGHALSLINYTFDSVLIGVLLGPGAVGWYAAAYKPVTAALTIPGSYFMGLFPTLARSYTENRGRFFFLVSRSVRLTVVVSTPVGVIGATLAAPVMEFLFGRHYLTGAPALQFLAVSVVLVSFRGNFRQAFNAAGQQRLDLVCAVTGVSANILFNLILVPVYGITGAAAATVGSELIWLFLSIWLFSKHVGVITSLPGLLRPAAGAAAAAISMMIAEPIHWMMRAALGMAVYLVVLGLLREPELMVRLPFRKQPDKSPAPSSATP